MHNRYHRCGPGGWAYREFFNRFPVNIEETSDAFIINLYAPSLIKENISVSTENDMLSIRYKAENTETSARYTRREYRTDEIRRSFELKGKVDTDKIKAAYAEGILKIELPKTTAAKKPPQDIRVG